MHRERKKSHDKIYPKGYVEMLEQQQGQLVQGLQEMYHRMLARQAWQGPSLSEATGQPLIHDILSALGLLEKKSNGSEETVPFEKDCEKLQARLIADGAVMTKRRGSFSSDSDNSHHAHSSSHSTPVVAKPPLFKETFSLGASPSPATCSTARKDRIPYPAAVQSPLHKNPPLTNNDPQLYQREWALAGQTLGDPEALMKTDFAFTTPSLQNSAFDLRDFTQQDALIDWPMMTEFDFGDMPYSSMTSNGFGRMPNFGAGAYDPMTDVDFKRFIATA